MMLENYVMNAVDKCVPSKTVRVFSLDQPWFTQKLRQLSRQKKRLYRKQKQTNPSASSKAKYQKVIIEFEKTCEVEKENYLQKIRQTNASKKSCWNLAKTLFRRSRSSKISKLRDQNNQEWSEDKMKAHVFNQHFAAICTMTTADYDKDIPPDKLPLSTSTLDLFTVTTREVEK
ncbi:unnamed protein product [Didymodactylos carnosus]|uniref:Uncharacterized protein n=1 Tax=Didymodactylos carnosus TaxID=1234261 RepID=A0A815D0X9_9BILA|nr:unnamed protein product [Didymodactylos carnosus]CAF4097259.1 unnamed protein product [Didymodactylos carnosus]